MNQLISGLERICKREKVKREELFGEYILEVEKYSSGWSEEKYDAKSNGNNLKSLELP